MVEAGIEDAHPEVAEALQDAVACFRHDLYRPTVVMLGKAMEGAWIELGCALARCCLPGTEADKVEAQLKSDGILVRKIQKVVKLYERTDLTQSVVQRSGVRPVELDSVVVWSDVLREARNAIHFGASPSMPNTYEKVAVLLLEAAASLKKMYRVKVAAEQLAPGDRNAG